MPAPLRIGLSVVVPCYNEARRVEAMIAGLDQLARLVSDLQVWIVDDGSTDGTADLAERLSRGRYRVLREPHRGKGGAVRAGVARCDQPWVMMADADWSTSPEQLLQLLPPRAPTGDVVIASRELPGARRVGEPASRHLLGRGFNALVRWSLLPGIQDSQCGFKAMRLATARDLFALSTLDGWAFDVELLYAARARGWRIVEVPVEWVWRSDSRVQPHRDAPRMARDVARVVRRARRGAYFIPRDPGRGDAT